MSHHYVRFTDVRYSYPGGYDALKGVSFLVTHGEHVAILGLNGAGKSTLLLHTNGLLLPTTGEVNIGGVPVTKKTLPLVRRSVGMVFQNPDDMLFMPTVKEDVAFGPLNMGLPKEEVEHRVNKALEEVGCLHLKDRASYQLSGGQKRLVAMATVFSMEPDILVLDEPTSNLDLKSKRELSDLIRNFRHTVLLATHDLELASDLCQRAIVIDDGKIIADTSVSEAIQKLISIIGESKS